MFGIRPRQKITQADWKAYMAQQAQRVKNPAIQQFFGTPLPDPETPISEVPMVALDMETTGLDERRHAIVSVGVVPFTLNRIKLAERRYWVVKPPRPLDEASIAFHHITHSEIAQAPDLDDILDELLAQLAGRLVVVHFRNIERPFLDAAVKARRGEGVLFPMIDTMSLEARLHRQTLWARFRRWLGRPPVSIRLHASRRRYGLPAYQGHHALVDALATAELLQAQIATHYQPETPLKDIWC
ncbi:MULTISPECIES: 3'-5' exonuclease [unclassified Halomonas]|uniref:3'-5' exonuclease n=1 Tax=unclassified Halomonas TaxID=2609666 RepID=UPI0007D9AFD8|nr:MULTISPECIES: 3'-5' exonuclease [unclassified Halomonas]MBT2785133.1 3'-5' exonuclease [Halomonas sp. ISL-106]MBT2796827.1 3'-5' exonuclease [Halomonas sp. ISL-104]OAL60052.1 DNA polymerase III subunit epsilon [Halomonas sp. ALS9]